MFAKRNWVCANCERQFVFGEDGEPIHNVYGKGMCSTCHLHITNRELKSFQMNNFEYKKVIDSLSFYRSWLIQEIAKSDVNERMSQLTVELKVTDDALRRLLTQKL